MIPSHWFRLIILIVFIMEVAGGILWVTARLTPDPAYKSISELVAGLMFLFGFYASAPLAARFLAPIASGDKAMQTRLAGIVATLPDTSPVFLYDHADKEANTVGLLASHTRIYMTTGLMANMSDAGVRGVIAHENTHIRERHIFFTFTYACCFAVGSHLTQNNKFFFAGFLIFLGLRRYCEYRADAGGAAVVGTASMLSTLKELATIYPSKAWHRWVSFATAYPTLSMRVRALQTGRKTML